MFFLFFGATLPGRISDNPPVINSLVPSVGKQREVCRQDEVLKDNEVISSPQLSHSLERIIGKM